jgi:NDP-sugar pyrophosphorylase family protein
MLMQMVILCGGLATRLGGIAKKIPKSMIDIDGKPFLEYQIVYLKKKSIKDIVLCVGHLFEKIEDYFGDGSKFGVNIKYSHDGDNPLGPIGAVKNAEGLLKDVFFIMYGDTYLSVDYQKVYSFFTQNDKQGLMVVYKNNDKFDKSNISIDNNMVTGYGENDAIYIDYGTSLLHKESLDIVPRNQMYSTGEFFSNLIKKNELLALETKERFYHIGNPVALEEFRNFIRRQ